MAVNPAKVPEPAKRYFPNDASPLLKLDPFSPRAYFIHSASKIIRDCPPSLPWASPFRGQVHRGLFLGPTSIAYFFYTLSQSHPDLEISGRFPLDWANAYLDLGQDTIEPLLDTSCGITNEYLASNTLKSCVYQDDSFARKVLDALKGLQTEKSWCEWLKGRAGALYMLRLMKEALPNLAAEINTVNTELIEDMLPQQPWVWDGRQYLGTVHGEIGILTQIILSDPSYAPKLEPKLLELLKQQEDNGNWPVIPGKDIGLIQFCHGAPGLVISLFSIKQYFQSLSKEIDQAIRRGRDCIWGRGLLTKEPNICHGILGNALALEGEQREHFLAMATPDLVEKGVEEGRFEKDWDQFGCLWGEAGRGWVWMGVWDGEIEEGKCALYSDV